MHLIKYLLFIVLSVSAFSQCTLSINPKTKRLECSGGTSVSGGAVGGASNLTTAGAVPFVTASGQLGQSSTFTYDSANGRLLTGGVAGAGTTVAVGAFSTLAGIWFGSNTISPSATNYGFLYDGSRTILNSPSTSIDFRIGNTLYARVDGTYPLDIQKSGSIGTLRIWDQTATTGSTLAVVQAGVAQSGNLTEWKNNAGTNIASMSSTGALAINGTLSATGGSTLFGVAGSYTGVYGAGGLSLLYFNGSSVARALTWNSTGVVLLGDTLDTGLARNAAGVLEVDSGTAGQYRDLILRRSQHSGVAVSALPAAAAGNAGSIQYVTDANATTISSVVAGGGSNKVLVWSDGTNWKIFAN